MSGGFIHFLKPLAGKYATATAADLRPAPAPGQPSERPPAPKLIGATSSDQGNHADQGEATPEFIHRVYSDLFDLLTLSPADRRRLTDPAGERQLTDSEIEAIGVKTLTGGARWACAQLVKRHGDRLATVPGFVKDRNGKTYLYAGDGHLLPARDLAGLIFGLRIRPYTPGDGPKYLWVSSASKGGPKASNRATVYQPLAGIQRPGLVGISEGEFKAFIAAQRLGYPVICVPGVSSWESGGAVELAQTLGHQAIIFYDSEKNRQTAYQRDQLADALTIAGLQVEIATWPGLAEGGKKGIDDLLLAGGEYRTYKHIPGLAGLPVSMVLSERYFDYSPSTNKKALLVKSPKNSGKSTWLAGVIEQELKAGGRVLSISHRVSLAKEQAGKFGLSFYQHHQGAGNLDGLPGLVITPDSSPNLSIKDYERDGLDLLVIDESEQNFPHVTGPTVKGKRFEVLNKLAALVKLARRVIFLDADLGPVSYNYLRRLGIAPDQIELVVNDVKPPAKTYVQVSHWLDLLAYVVRDLQEGKRPALFTNSKKHAKIAGQLLADLFPNKAGWCVHSHSLTNDTEHEKVAKINETVVTLDWLVASPSLGTGVSIDVPHFDNVYLLGVEGVNTHKDLLQQVGRVRNPKSGKVYCWVKNYHRDLETDQDRLEMLAARSARETARLLGADLARQTEQRLAHSIEAGYLALKADIQAARAASWADLAGNFWRAVELDGHQIEQAAEFGKEDRGQVKSLYSEARDHLKKRRIDGIMAAPDLTLEEYNSQKNRRSLDEPQRLALQRFSIRRFYGDVTPELIEDDNEGRARSQITMLLATADPDYARELDQADYVENWHTGQPARMLADLGHYNQKSRLLAIVLEKAGYNLAAPDFSQPFSLESLKQTELMAWLDQPEPNFKTGETGRELVERLLGQRIKTETGLTKLVTGALARLGLECECEQIRTGETFTDQATGKVKAVRERRYLVKPDSLEKMQRLGEARRQVINQRRQENDQAGPGPLLDTDSEADSWAMAA